MHIFQVTHSLIQKPRFSSILIAIGLCICLFSYPFRQITSNSLVINPNSSGSLVGRLYRPINATNPLPVVILVHGVSSSKEMMIPLAIELARNNIASLTFDFGGFGESHSLKKNQQSIDYLTQSTVKDAKSILNYVENNPQQFDIDKIAIAGHSMGGVTAIDLAKKNPQLKSTVALGIGGEATFNSPKNLLFAIGTYEQLNPANQLRPIIAIATENPQDCLNQEACGNFVKGTARKLTISPTTDHFTVIFDSNSIDKTINWIKQSLQISSPKVPIVMPQFIIGMLIGMTGLILELVLFLVKHPQLIRWRSLTIFTGILILIAPFNIISPIITTHLLIILFFVNLISNYAYVCPHEWRFNCSLLLIYMVILLIAFWTATILHSSEELFKKPISLIYLPIFSFKWLFLMVYNAFLKIKILMFSNYSFVVIINPIFIIILILDFLKLGIILGTIEKVTFMIINCLRQPFKLGFKNISRKEIAILLMLTIICLFVIWQRYNEGLLNDAINQGQVIGKLFIIFIITPIATSLVILRSSFLQKIEINLRKQFLH